MYDLYDVTVPTFIRSLTNLKGIVQKAHTFAQEKKIDDSVLLQDRLAPDMFPLVRQIQIVCDNAKGTSARLAGVEAPKMEDTETTCADLEKRIDATLTFVQSLKKEQFADAPNREIELYYMPGTFMKGEAYALEYGVPNFFFHLTVAYSILRHNGVALGKADFIGQRTTYTK